MMDGDFNLIAARALKFRGDLQIVCRRSEPLFDVILKRFRDYCAGGKVDKTTFLLRVRQVAMRCDYNVDALVLTAVDVFNEAQRSADTTTQGKKRSHDGG